MNYPKKIFLLGMPGSGKSTLGKKLAEKIGRNFFDLDQEIERMAGWVIEDIFSQVGEDYFRELEQGVLEMLVRLNEASVIATGGGTPCFHENMKLMNENGKSIFLNVSLDTILARVSENKSTRPIIEAMNEPEIEKSLKALYKKRLSYYEKASFTTSNNLSKIIKFLDSVNN